jgi:hypothetical protein
VGEGEVGEEGQEEEGGGLGVGLGGGVEG